MGNAAEVAVPLVDADALEVDLGSNDEAVGAMLGGGDAIGAVDDSTDGVLVAEMGSAMTSFDEHPATVSAAQAATTASHFHLLVLTPPPLLRHLARLKT